MEFNYRPTDHAHALAPPLTFTPPPPPLNFSYAPPQHLPGHEGWGYNGFHLLEGPNSAIEMSQFMRREMEKGQIREEIMMENAWRHIQKERIREEIIVDEIMTRRLLESEVRRELSIERELGLQRGGDLFIGPRGFPAPLVPFEVEGRPLGERFMTSLGGRLGMSSMLRPEFGGLGTGLQTSVNTRIFEAKPPFGNGKQKEKIVLPARPLQDVNVSVLSSAGSAKKQLTEEWSCALCQVTASSEQGLNEHLQGKRHKSKEAGLRKKCNIGWFTEKTQLVSSKDAPLVTSKVSNKSEQNIVKSAESASPSQDPNNTKRKDYSFDDSGEHSEAMVGERKNSPDNKNVCNFWCETCQVGVGTLKEMEEHRKGKKHLAQLQKSSQNTKEMQVIEESSITKTDSGDGENSASEDSSAVFHKVDLEEQLEEEANVGAETAAENPEKSGGPTVIISQHLDDSVHHIDLEAQHEEEANVGAETSSENPEKSGYPIVILSQLLDDFVRHIDLETQLVEEANIGAETSSEISEKSGDPRVIISQHLDNSVQHSGSPIERKQEHENSLQFWCEMCRIGTHSEKVMEAHRAGKKHLAQLQKSNLNTQVIQVGQELTVTKKDGNDGENSESEDSSAVAHKVELEDQQEKVANVNAETSSDTPTKSDPLITVSRQLDNSVRNSGTPIVRTQEHKRNWFRFWCEMCRIGTDTEKDIEIHRTGKKHLAHKKQLFRFWCDVCQIGIDTEKVMEIHRTGKKHLSQLQKIYQNPGDEYLNFAMQPVQDAEANSLGTKNSCNLLKHKSQLSDVCMKKKEAPVCMKKKEAPVWRMKETQGLKKCDRSTLLWEKASCPATEK